MHTIHQQLISARSLPAQDGGRFHNVADKILKIIDNYRNDSISLSEYKIALTGIKNKFGSHKFDLHKETLDWISELLKAGSTIKE